MDMASSEPRSFLSSSPPTAQCRLTSPAHNDVRLAKVTDITTKRTSICRQNQLFNFPCTSNIIQLCLIVPAISYNVSHCTSNIIQRVLLYQQYHTMCLTVPSISYNVSYCNKQYHTCPPHVLACPLPIENVFRRLLHNTIGIPVYTRQCTLCVSLPLPLSPRPADARSIYFPASGQAAVTGVVRPPPA